MLASNNIVAGFDQTNSKYVQYQSKNFYYFSAIYVKIQLFKSKKIAVCDVAVDTLVMREIADSEGVKLAVQQLTKICCFKFCTHFFPLILIVLRSRQILLN